MVRERTMNSGSQPKMPASSVGTTRSMTGAKLDFRVAVKNLLGAFGSDKLNIFQLGKERGNLVHGKGIVGRHGKEVE